MNKILKIMDKLNSIEYGFKDKNGNNLINSERWDKEFYKFYFLLSPEELLSSKCGVCWDQVELERKLFRILSVENSENNHFRQHISDVKAHLLSELQSTINSNANSGD